MITESREEMGPQPGATGAVCARHPDRATGIRCQRCGNFVCHECMVPAPVGVQCRDCVQAAAKQTRQIIGVGSPFLTYGLIAVNVAVAALCVAVSPEWVDGATGRIALEYGLIGGGFGVIDGRPQFIGVDTGESYRVITAAFIHGGPIHLLFNMLILWQLGSALEPGLGRLRYGMLFAVSVLGGSFGALLLNPDGLTVGASGGVFGLMGAYFIAERKGLTGARSGLGIGGLIIINLVLSVAIPGISLGGHVGGLLAGGALGLVMFEFQSRRLPETVPVLLSGGMALLLFTASLWAAGTWKDPLL